MGVTDDAAQSSLLAALPPGLAFSRHPTSNHAKFLRALGKEFVRVEQRLDELRLELTPHTCSELLREWEQALGLPDPCFPPSDDLEVRLARVLARWRPQPSPTIPNLEAWLLEHTGVAVTIEQADPPDCGEMECGDELNHDDNMHVLWFRAPAIEVDDFECGEDECGTALGEGGDPYLECLVQRVSPGHAHPIVTYGP